MAAAKASGVVDISRLTAGCPTRWGRGWRSRRYAPMRLSHYPSGRADHRGVLARARAGCSQRSARRGAGRCWRSAFATARVLRGRDGCIRTKSRSRKLRLRARGGAQGGEHGKPDSIRPNRQRAAGEGVVEIIGCVAAWSMATSAGDDRERVDRDAVSSPPAIRRGHLWYGAEHDSGRGVETADYHREIGADCS